MSDFQSGNVNAIYDLYVGDTGLLFLGTDKGLMTYNGIFYNSYGFIDNLALSVHRIQQDAAGNVWCKNFSNQLFVLKNGTLIPNKKVQELCSKSNENFVDFTFVKNQLYILTEKKLYKENKDGLFTPILDAIETDAEVFFSIHSFNDQLSIAGSLKVIELKNDEVLQSYKTDSGQKELLKYKGELFYLSKGERNDLTSFEKGNYLLNNIAVNTYFYGIHTTEERMWLCTSNGLYKLDNEAKKSTEKILPNSRVTKIVQDKEGGCWISTLDDGLFYMPNQSMQHSRYQNFDGISSKFISLALADDGHLFAGTSHGTIIEYDGALQPLRVYKGNNNVEVEYIYLHNNQIISTVGVFEKENENPIIDVYFGKGVDADEFGNFIFANYNFAGFISQTFKNLPKIPGEIIANDTTTYYYKDIPLFKLRNKRARIVHYSKKYKEYYIGYSDGLYHYQLDGTVQELKTTSGQPIIAVDIEESTNGILWVATAQHGIFQIVNNKVVLNLNGTKGLSKNRCKKIHVSDKGLWIITDEGINFYDAVAKKLINYLDRLGLSDTRINDFIVEDDKILLATSEGIIHFNKAILDKKIKPVFEIKARLNSNDPATIKNDTILPYGNRQIEFEFQTIYFKSLGNFDYEYLLEPLHNEWQTQTSKQEKLNFLSLQPNTYNLKARIKTGSNYSEVQSFTFKLDKPFWAKWWFQLAIIWALLLLLLLVYKWAALRTKRKQNTKEKLAISQLTALRLQMNPHFMFNVLNAVQGLIYSNQKSKATEYLGTFSSLMRKTLDMSDKKEVTIADEVETIEIYVSLEKARFEDEDFEFEIILPEEDLNAFAIPSLIIQPFVENAIKHGLMHKQGKKRLLIKVSKANKHYWEFLIEDNGVGREISAHINSKIKDKHHSFATKAIDNRINLINKLIDKPISIDVIDLTTNQLVSTGTRVHIHIPIKEI